MAGIDPISLVSSILMFQQSRHLAKDQSAAAQAEAASQLRQIKTAQNTEERRQRNRLRKALATQRARYGAAGIGGVGGSSKALLQGFVDETEESIEDMHKSNQIRIDDIYRNLSYRRRKSLLDKKSAATGLATNLWRQGARAVSLLDR